MKVDFAWCKAYPFELIFLWALCLREVLSKEQELGQYWGVVHSKIKANTILSSQILWFELLDNRSILSAYFFLINPYILSGREVKATQIMFSESMYAFYTLQKCFGKVNKANFINEILFNKETTLEFQACFLFISDFLWQR